MVSFCSCVHPFADELDSECCGCSNVRTLSDILMFEARAHGANALITEVIAPPELGMVADVVNRTAEDGVVEALRAKVIPT